MKTEKRKIGDIGENLSVKFLEKKGYKIIEQNYLKKFGEIDIVAFKEDKKKIFSLKQKKVEKKYYFFEVKTISTNFENFEKTRITPEDNFTKSKIIKFDRIVEFYVRENKIKEDYYLGVLFVYIDIEKKKSKIRFIDKIEI